MILVAGATGTVGRHLVLELKARRAALRVLTRDPARAERLLGPAEYAVGDLSRPETVAKALAGVEAAFVLSPLDPALAAWESDFARAAKKAGVRKLVLVSGLGADPRSPAAVARWHGDAEDLVRRAGVPAVVLRPAPFYQNLLARADAIRRGVLPAPMGSGRVAMIDARDVAAAAAAALLSPSDGARTLTLTGPAAPTYGEIAQTLSRVLGRPVAYSDVDPRDAERALLAAGMPAWRTDAILGLAEAVRAGLMAVVSEDARAATGREPISFELFVRDHAAAFA